MQQIPEFDQAVDEFREVLAAAGHPREVSWIFREDFYAPGIKRFVVVEPRPEANRVLAETYYERARATGSVLLRGMFRVGEVTAASVWTPTEVSDKAAPGLKLTVADPFPEAKRVKAGLSWWLHRLSPAYRYNLERSFDVPLRRLVATG